jgi:hypothetical protein
MTCAKSSGGVRTSSRISPSHLSVSGEPPAALSARRRGVRRHPLLASALASGDRKFDYETFAAAMLADLAPVGAVETTLAARAAGLAWRLNRAQALESGYLSRPTVAQGLDSPRQVSIVDAMQRWEASLQRSLLQVLRGLNEQRTQRTRANGQAGQPNGMGAVAIAPPEAPKSTSETSCSLRESA